MARLVKHLTLDRGSGHDLKVVRSQPCVSLRAGHGVCLTKFSFSLCLCPLRHPPPALVLLTHTLSLSLLPKKEKEFIDFTCKMKCFETNDFYVGFY